MSKILMNSGSVLLLLVAALGIPGSCQNVTQIPPRTVAPLPSCHYKQKEADCKALDPVTCTWTNYTTSSGAAYGKCTVQPCIKYLASECPMDRCSQDGGRCLPQTCTGFSQNSCYNRYGCYWAREYLRTTQAPIKTTLREVCLPYHCTYIYASKLRCDDSPNCFWSDNDGKCQALPCNSLNNCLTKRSCTLGHNPDYSPNQEQSAGTTESSNSGMYQCQPKMCSQYSYDTCPQHACKVDANTMQCVDNECRMMNFRYEADCKRRVDCMYQPHSRVSYSKCVHKPCNYHGRDQRKCSLAKCWFNTKSKTCNEHPCSFVSDSKAQCNAVYTCQWSTWTAPVQPKAACQPKHCYYRVTPDACTRPCRWDHSTKKCGNFKCTDYTSEESCPTANYHCQWSQLWGTCNNRMCVITQPNKTVCHRIQGCMYKEDGINACVDKYALYKASCTVATSKLQCTSYLLPWRRCQWNEEENFCGPYSASTSTQPSTYGSGNQCSKVPIGSDDDKCPSDNCVMLHGVCTDPVCKFLTSSGRAKCWAYKCRWNGTSCVDPRSHMYPCSVYGDDKKLCPRGRCLWSTEKKECHSPPSQDDGNGDNDDDETDAKRCSKIDTVSACAANDHCMFNETSAGCGAKACSQFSDDDSCPDRRCKWRDGACHKPCPGDRSVFCPDLGTCVTHKRQCTGCGSTQTQCWNGNCKLSRSQCPCPPSKGTRCPNTNYCVSNATHCDLACAVGTVRCWNNDCANSYAECPCPTTRSVKCRAGSQTWCAVNKKQCGRKCPKCAPHKCDDGSCARNIHSCPCTGDKPHRCSTNRKCYASKQECPCRRSTSTRCEDLSCAPEGMECGETPAPPPTDVPCTDENPYRCPDRSCAKHRFDCIRNQCEQDSEEGSTPEIKIYGRDGDVDVNRWFRLRARAKYQICGIEVGFRLPVTWTAYLPSTGKTLVFDKDNEAKVRVRGGVMTVPPRTFTKGETYVISASVTSPDSYDNFTVSASVTIKGIAQPPRLYFLGGAKRVMEGHKVTWVTYLRDPSQRRPDLTKNFTWVCSADFGLGDCPATILDTFESATGRYVRMTDVPEGNYTITVYYKGIVNASAQIEIKNQNVPKVNIWTRLNPKRVFANEEIKLYACVRASTAYTIQWSVNGQVLEGQTTRRVTIPAELVVADAELTVTINATLLSTGLSAFSSVTIRPLAQVVGSCSLQIVANPDGEGRPQALKTTVRMTGDFNVSSGTHLKYKFAYMDQWSQRWAGRQREYQLSSFWQTLSYLDFIAPVYWVNEAKVGTFVVKVYGWGETYYRGVTTCTLEVQPSSESEIIEAAAAAASEMDQALETDDTATAVDAASTCASALGSHGKRNKRPSTTAKKVIDAMQKLASKTKESLSQTERGQVVKSVQRVMQATKESDNEMEVKEFAKENAKKMLSVVKDILSSDDEDSQLDVQTDGSTVLDVLSNTRVEGDNNQNQEVAKECKKLGMRIAKAATMGIVSKMREANITVTGTATSADDLEELSFGDDEESDDEKEEGDAEATKEKKARGSSRMKFPKGFKLNGDRDENNRAELSSVTYDENPVGKKGCPAKTKSVGRVAEFSVQVDGKDETIKDQDPPMEIEFKLSEKQHKEAKSDSKFHCRYFVDKKKSNTSDENDGEWSDKGVKFKSYDHLSGKVTCTTSHLSTFGLFEEDDSIVEEPVTTAAQQQQVTTTTAGQQPATTAAITQAQGGVTTAAQTQIGQSTAAQTQIGQSTTAQIGTATQQQATTIAVTNQQQQATTTGAQGETTQTGQQTTAAQDNVVITTATATGSGNNVGGAAAISTGSSGISGSAIWTMVGIGAGIILIFVVITLLTRKKKDSDGNGVEGTLDVPLNGLAVPEVQGEGRSSASGVTPLSALQSAAPHIEMEPRTAMYNPLDKSPATGRPSGPSPLQNGSK